MQSFAQEIRTDTLDRTAVVGIGRERVRFTRGAKASGIGVVLAAMAMSLTGCTTALPSARPATHGLTAPTPSTTTVAYMVPAVQRGELARIADARPGPVDGVSVHVPAGTLGYDIDYGCKAANPRHKFGFELLHGTTRSVAGSTLCDGIAYRDTALVPHTPAETVHLVFTGDMSEVSDAYLVLFPSNDN